jgi:hypothetical protein
MKKMIAVALAALTLTGCDFTKRNVVSNVTEYRQYKIMEIDPPKRMYVTLSDMKTGKIYHEYVKKRCSNWRDVVQFSETALMTQTITYDDGLVRTYINATPICPSY